MSRQNYISSSFWSDEWIDSLSIKEKLLYLHLMTNECTNVAGVYKITIKRMKDDTGLSREEVIDALNKFSANKKAFYMDEYIIIPKWPKHQKFGERGKLALGAISILKSLPDSIKDFIIQPGNYEYDTSFLRHTEYTPEADRVSAKEENSGYPIGKTEEKPMGYAKFGIPHRENSEKADRVCQNSDTLSHDLDLDIDLEYVCVNSDEFTHTDEVIHRDVSPPEKSVCDFSKSPEKLFLHIWQTTPGNIFNALARIESPKEWARFWSTAPPTCDEVRRVMQNVIDDVNSGAIERRYIPKTPDRFVIGGGFTRHKERFRQLRQTSPPQSNQAEKKSL